MAATQMSDQPIIRRSANYDPSIWDYDYVQSLRSKYAGEMHIKQVEKLKDEVRLMLGAVVDHLHQLELIDTLQRLGVSYHFEEDIKRILDTICNKKRKQESLHAVALEFRLLRQHGFDISAEIFSHFKDEKGIFKSCLRDDCQGLLDLYEAAYLLVEEEESIFHEIRNLTTTYLKEYVNHNKDDEYLSTLVNHALELPLEWRMPRLEARWFIDVYGKRQEMNPILLDFAKLDFNIVQAMHQEDVKHASRWWKNTGLARKLSFARDRLVECFLWNVGTLFQPQFGYCRILVTKLMALISTIDDVYDVYGTLDELELFTDAIERWDVNAMEQLPHYMKISFLALHNSINEIAFDALKEQELHIIPYLKKEWADVCKTLLLEARWYHSGYVPTLGEYIENALISIGGPMVLVHTYFFITNPIRKEAFECLREYHSIIRYASIITRLADDLGTSSEELKRGDVPKSIQCYMHEAGVYEENAREHIRALITTTWMKMNKERVKNCHLPDALNEFAMNAVRTALCIYQHGDGYGIGEGETKARILSLLVNPIL